MLLDPRQARFGAAYADRAAMIEDAVGYIARQPLRDRGLRERVHGLSKTRAQLSRGASDRVLHGHDKFYLLQRKDALALRERLEKCVVDDGNDEGLIALLDALDSLEGTWLMCTTKAGELIPATGSEVDSTDLAGVLRAIPPLGSNPAEQ